ncbi:MAG: enoyl-CoA hydratase/isomerase family protein, partial [Burkholderiales bacterium]
PQALGHQRAMELIVLGEQLDARSLQSLGLVNRVVPAAQVLPAALALAEQVAERASHATALLKKALTGQADALEKALATEQAAAAACFAHPETARRIGDFGGHKG